MFPQSLHTRSNGLSMPKVSYGSALLLAFSLAWQELLCVECGESSDVRFKQLYTDVLLGSKAMQLDPSVDLVT